jgi:tetratricopeptide (TPR) repeat protein
MRGTRTAPALAATLAVACAGAPERHTLGELRSVEPDMTEMRVENGLEQAMVGYRKFLEEAPESALTPEAMRRLADLKLEKQYGILGDAEIVELPAPEPGTPADAAEPGARDRAGAAGAATSRESEAAFEQRAAGETGMSPASAGAAAPLPDGQTAPSGPLEAIALYDQILTTYPSYPFNDQVLYQKSRAYDELGRVDEAIAVMERLVAEYPHSRHIGEVQFRRAEYFFTRRRYLDAEEAYAAITRMGAASEYYELALYKLGWTFYKQELHEEALHEYIALLDYKVSTGYDFDQSEDEEDERRIADTYRVISLSFSSLGGPEIVKQYFADTGGRSYEDRIYGQLGEFYLEKLRYQDAAAAYQAFIDLHALHRSSPHFGMRVVEIYEAGGFPKLVLESKKDFAARYGLQAEYWQHFEIEQSPEVRSYLQSNLQDLASHYHALFQQADLADDRPANFDEALRWYRAYLASFPAEPEAPGINYRLADLLLEDRRFGEAAREYERTAYDHPAHERAAAAGYAAIYAHREDQKQAEGEHHDAVRREAVASTLRFVDAFPQHEHAAAVLGAAVDDLYDMRELDQAIAVGHRLIDAYPGADVAIRRSAWLAIAHASFDTLRYPEAEHAYARVLEITAEADDSRQDVVENLAATIYKQGEQANAAQDHRAAADHFLRIAQSAPGSKIRPLAEYDAGAALIELKDWSGAAAVFESFREAHPDHELNREATRQIASLYREQGELARAADEYQRVSAEADDTELSREALLVAAELFEDAKAADRALAAYLDYVRRFPEPLETAVETRFKIAAMHQAAGDDAAHHEELRRIVEIDRAAGGARTPRIQYLAARSALVLTEGAYERFAEVVLLQPFEKSLQHKQRRMNEALDAFGALVDYEVAEVTAAATFYMAEVYSNFSRSLMESERPADLDAAGLQDYELVLEEEAYPFEERAIEVHEKNVELMVSGIWNPWVEKSLARLAALMPGRYAKAEESSGFIAAIDEYAYRAPAAPVAEPAAAVATATGGPAPDAPAPAAEAAEPVAPEGAAIAPDAAAAADAVAPDAGAPADAVAPEAGEAAAAPPADAAEGGDR